MPATATTAITDLEAPLNRLDPLIRQRDLPAIVGLSRTQIWRLRTGRSPGGFPAEVQITPTIIGWRLSDIEEWLASRPYVDADASEAEAA